MSMSSFAAYAIDQLGCVPDFSWRAMMGGYVFYCGGKVVGGLYGDGRVMVKPTPAARRLLPGAAEEPPYEGAKPMLLLEDLDDRALLQELLPAVADELPAPKPKKQRSAK